LRQELIQSPVDRLLLLVRISIPVDNFMRKTLAAATNNVTYPGGTDTDARRSYRSKVGHAASKNDQFSSLCRQSLWIFG
jgi:hypothetical protein